jgi:predicted cupin superfamily sugar epimerase
MSLLHERETWIDANTNVCLQTVIPGFEYSDHDFLTMEKFKDLVTEEQAKELEWLVRKS